MRCFINQLAQSNRYLHLAAQKLLKIILETAQSNGSSMGPVEVIKALTSENGSPSFDHLTKSKAVEKLLSVSNSDQLSAVLEHFQEILCNPGIDEAVGAEKVRQQLADQLIALIRHGKAAKSSPCINEVIAMQIGFGYFTTKILSRQQTIQPPFSASSQAIFRTRLTSTLTLLMSSKETMIEPWPYKAVCYIQSALDEGHQLVMELDQLVHEAQLDTSRTLKRIDRKVDSSIELVP
jgi:DNA polymerase phi